MGRPVGERDTPPHHRLLLHTLRRLFTGTPDGGVETKYRDGGHPCPTGAPHLGISHLHPNLQRFPPRPSLHSFRGKKDCLRPTRRPFLSDPYHHQSTPRCPLPSMMMRFDKQLCTMLRSVQGSGGNRKRRRGRRKRRGPGRRPKNLQLR